MGGTPPDHLNPRSRRGQCYLLTNAALGWQHLTFRDIAFSLSRRMPVLVISTRARLRSDCAIGFFERCLWNGSWRYGIQLEGANSNDT
jgi:hypothetical protein